MFSPWHAVYASLLAETNRRDHHIGFDKLRQIAPCMALLTNTEALLAHQRGSTATPEAKDLVLRTLIAQGRREGSTGKAAQRVLLLALWPGLDAIRGRLRRYYASRTDDLTADILGHACELAGQMDLSQVNRIAATFLRNIERDLRRGLQADWRRAALTQEHDDADADANDGGEVPGSSVLCADAGTAIDQRRLLGRVRAIAGADADLVLAVVHDGLSQREAGVALGIGHEAARKRYQRAVDRLRAAPLHI
jgi:RNA polymerase sigma-70 factor (ECF subfamily)